MAEEYETECNHSMDSFAVADSNGGMYCTICHPELFGGTS